MGPFLAEKPDSPAGSKPDTWTWTFPGSPIRVRVPLKLISALQADVQDISAKGTSKIEVGGVLLGHPGNGSTTEIHEYAYVPTESQADGKYVFDVSIWELEALLKANSNGSGGNGAQPLSVVGYFRTHSEVDLRLRDEEVDLVRKHFSDRSNVVLLMQPAGAASKAGFLFWSGDEFYPFSFMDFPLDAEELRFSSTRNAAESPLAPLDQPETEEEPAQAAIAPRNAAPTQGHPGRTLAVVSVAVLALAGLSALWFRHRPPDAPTPAPVNAAPAPGSPMQLEVEARGQGVEIRWNPANPLITHALNGNLVVIEQGQPPEITPLDSAHLATGHVYYQTSSGRVDIQLQVVDPSGKVSTDSVMMLSSRSKAALPRATADRPRSGRAVANPAEIESAPIAKTREAIPASPPAVRAFTPPPVRRPTPEQAGATLLDAPAAVLSAAGTAAVVSMPAIVKDPGVPQVRAVAPPPPPPPPPEKQAPVAKQLKAGGALQPGSLIKKVDPIYPEALRVSRIQGTVRFRATIGKDGRIRELQLVSGNPVLVQPATNAVKQWQYRPTMLDGEPVEVTTQIDVEFALNR